MTTLALNAPEAHLSVLLRLADDQLVLGHRLSEWTGHAPTLEEDIALANIALDHIGAARALYDRAAQVHGAGLTQDDYAYRRDARGYVNCLLVERPNGDFAHTIVRQLFYSAFMLAYWDVLATSADATLAAIAERSEKEARYHVRHSSGWFVRLGDGTAESRRRTEAAVAALWPYTGELFEVDAVLEAALAAAILTDARAVQAQWRQTLAGPFAAANLAPPAVAHMHSGGRSGRHTEHLGALLAQLQYLQHAYPGAAW